MDIPQEVAAAIASNKQVKTSQSSEFSEAICKIIQSEPVTKNEILLKEVVSVFHNYETTYSDLINTTDGYLRQLELLQAMVKLINETEPEHFKKNWNIILSYFWNFKDWCFGIKRINRYVREWPADSEDSVLFQRLVNLCMVSANPEDRQKAKRLVNIPMSVESGLLPAGVSNIYTFYNL